MASVSERRKEVLLAIQDRINKTSIKQEEKSLLEKTKDFRKLLQLGILMPNEKVGPFYNGYWLKKVNGSNWTFKISKEPGIPRSFFLEIINERIATAYGFNTIKSKIVKMASDSNFYGIMSEDYRDQKYTVVTGADIVTDYLNYLEEAGYFEERFGVKTAEELDENMLNVNSLPVIYQALNYHFKKRADFPEALYTHDKNSSVTDCIYNELVKRYIYSYITMQKDFHLRNWEILENENAAYLSPMYDLEMSFQDNFYDDKNTSLRANINGSLSINEDFSTFISQSKENKKLVMQMHYMLIPTDISSFMKKRNPYDITIPLSLQKEITNMYTEHFLKIEDMLTKDNKLKKEF